MSCEIIPFSALTRPTRPVCGQQTPAEVSAIGNRALTPRQRRREGKPELPPFARGGGPARHGFTLIQASKFGDVSRSSMKPRTKLVFCVILATFV